MNIADILENYDLFKEPEIKDRFLKHNQLIYLLDKLPAVYFTVAEVGKSEEGRSLNLVKWGNGPTRVFLWSQMHGDEATGTMALFDLFNFLQCEKFSGIAKNLGETCTLIMLPMVNPDGAERFTRRNAKQIDINRDYLALSSAESRILKGLRDQINPHFGFNLHDQDTLWSVAGTLKPATLSFLAPTYDEALSVNATRRDAMLVIASIFKELDQLIPGYIGLFKDEYEPRAFGDNFQLAGTSTILIEAGGYQDDHEKQIIRQYYFLSILGGLWSVATRNYASQELSGYLNIPKNDKQIFHLLIHNVVIDNLETSIGINYEQHYDSAKGTVQRCYFIKDIGDLSYCDAYQTYNGKNTTISGKILFEDRADFVLLKDAEIILSFSNGLLV